MLAGLLIFSQPLPRADHAHLAVRAIGHLQRIKEIRRNSCRYSLSRSVLALKMDSFLVPAAKKESLMTESHGPDTQRSLTCEEAGLLLASLAVKEILPTVLLAFGLQIHGLKPHLALHRLEQLLFPLLGLLVVLILDFQPL